MKLGEKIGPKSLFEATSIIQELFSDPRANLADVENLLKDAQAGRPGANFELQNLIIEVMEKYEITVQGYTAKQVAREIYDYAWGLGPVESIYRNPTVNEIRVNRYNQVFYQKQGRNYKADLEFKDNQHVTKIIERLIVHDRASLSKSSPSVESRRLDGSRLTAFYPPFSPFPGFVLRKSNTFKASAENYISTGMMDEYTVQLLSTLVRGRANILISGGTGTGKTTLLRWLAGYMHSKLRIVTLETDYELFLEEFYPERDIVPLEEHKDLGVDMKKAFSVILRLTPDVIIVGEARGLGEASQMIQACMRGHDGSMGTIHVGSIYDAVSTLAQMALEEGRRLPINLIESQVAKAFDVVVQLYGNNVTGVKKVTHIAEIHETNNVISFHDLVKWKPSADGFEKGHWEHLNPVSDTLAAKLFRYGVRKPEQVGLLVCTSRLSINGGDIVV
jgi:pilus assembly protein CpaF